MALATFRIETNDPSSPKDIPMSSLIGNDAQVANCPSGYVGDAVPVAQGAHAEQTLAEANAAALAAGEAQLDCVIDTNPSLEMDLLTGVGTQSSGLAIVSLGGGPILVGGPFIRVDAITQSYLARGDAASPTELDTEFTPVVNDTVSAIVVVGSDYYIGGTFETVNGHTTKGVAKLSSANVVDTAFIANIITGGGSGGVSRMVRQADGKFVVAGSFTTIDGVAQTVIGRINADGSHDATFTPTTFVGSSVQVNAIAIQADGKIVCGGQGFSSVNGTARRGMFRLNSDGTLDSGFTADLLMGADTPICHSITLDEANSRIYIGGVFNRINAVTGYNALARIALENGAADATWKPTFTGYSFQRVRCIQALADGGIAISGDFTTVCGVAQVTMAIVESTSAVCRASFAPVFATFTTVGDFVQEPISGQLLVTGSFAAINSISRNSIARLDLDGTLA